jgi:hypothetical protein
MTESTAVGTRGFNSEKFQNYSSIGLLAPNMQAKVVDWNTGSFSPPGSSGELWLRGPAIMKGNKFHQFPELLQPQDHIRTLGMLISHFMIIKSMLLSF